MAVEKELKVRLQDNFYRDSFGKAVIFIAGLIICLVALILTIIYLYLDRPPPITFPVDQEMRIQSAVPLNEPYLSEPEVLQWIADVLPKSFHFDFNYYNSQLKDIEFYFTQEGWKQFLGQLNMTANYNTVQANKLFIRAVPGAAPFLENKGVIEETGIYGWWVLMPVNITYAGYKPLPNKLVTFRILIVRVSTLNNLKGVGIDKIIEVPLTRSGGQDNR